ncbi:hypothetical protein ALP86_02612 [Pseudomonas amygdali pv. mori]|uniref:AB hydrolase-1 domain-containing protein n=1 Tax=Pseudomonas savastanoi pv. glycinea TaxID=318 RepID=A0A3M3V901_PSESG|nr:hypothetical protein ALQ74_04416 [Pseudomonas savastanoi pv. glycinea]RMR48367.1 hypothetical protein ALP86_02612 [Pseudomonas amygdali pv. mori]RMM95326.1 hypothetical protein ALQ70_04619 [Pseudomonas savastanoi pv. glycinea]RMN18634.1 hypothetical protein ALQ66_04971 [Pseudomonas savastanoi pv. glycinea]RMO41986.1 hypothetical protein ALQ43_05132 [Pseudomonas savastanoi pv. glycinea]
MSKHVSTRPTFLSHANPFVPAVGMGNPHLQTLWGPLLRKPTLLARTRERLWLKDGDFLDMDWHGPDEPDKPLVLVLHGLTGSSNSPYVAGLQKAMAAQGWPSVALNWRGCSGEPNLLSRSYHSGASEDLAEVIAHLRSLRPLAPIYAAGYSLGGNVLLKYLGESGASSDLRGAVAVSVPFRLDECANRIGQGFSRVYQRHFMREMLAYIRDKQHRFQHEGISEGLAELAALGSLENMRTFWDFHRCMVFPTPRITTAGHPAATIWVRFRRRR